MDLGIDPISNVADAAAKIISLFKTNPSIKLADDFQLQETTLQGQIQEVLAQIQVNAVEAASKSIWVAGWRPYIGWICGSALAVPPLMWAVQCSVLLWHHNYQLPPFNSGELVTILLGLLGLGGMRTYEKVNNAADESHGGQ
jgi:hypothetical protein